MNMYTNTKKIRKFILVLVLLILFSFCYPKNVKAGIGEDILAAPAKIFWLIEEGILRAANNMFVRDDLKIKDNDGEINLTPENIIKGKFLIFDANIFKEVSNAGYLDYKEDRYFSKRKNRIKRYNFRLVLCTKKFYNCSVAFSACICRNKNDIINCSTR